MRWWILLAVLPLTIPSVAAGCHGPPTTCVPIPLPDPPAFSRGPPGDPVATWDVDIEGTLLRFGVHLPGDERPVMLNGWSPGATYRLHVDVLDINGSNGFDRYSVEVEFPFGVTFTTGTLWAFLAEDETQRMADFTFSLDPTLKAEHLHGTLTVGAHREMDPWQSSYQTVDLTRELGAPDNDTPGWGVAATLAVLGACLMARRRLQSL